MKCLRCKYEWINRTVKPKQCPRCRSWKYLIPKTLATTSSGSNASNI